ncbi:DNA adenine methylase [Vibrio crassostreae]|uniref:DNA adenine methylase n=1 Tax=Vibrio crassostreae TaxID=246167 RepID=UPI00352F72A3
MLEQLNLDPILSCDKIDESKNDIFRPIHYLGSKLRVLEQIDDIMSNLASNGDHIVDLFSGSGTVSNFLSNKYSVTANDIQEYSRVINSALLCSTSGIPKAEEFLVSCRNSRFHELSENCITPLINIETSAIKESFEGDNRLLCDIIESGSIMAGDATKESPLYDTLQSAKQRLDDAKVLQSNNFIATKYFGGVYFSYRQAVDIDLIAYEISLLKNIPKDIYLAALLSTVSEVVNSVGKHFAQPIRPRYKDGRPKNNLAKSISKDREIDVMSTYEKFLFRYIDSSSKRYKNSATRLDFGDCLKESNDIKVVYADPPYTRDHYSRFYHVLETLALQDSPNISTTKIHGEVKYSRGIYRENRHQSPFCIRSKAPNAFERLFSLTRNSGASLILSYSPFSNESKTHPRVMDIDTINKLGKKYFSNIDCISAGELRHSKLNHSSKHLEASDEAELFLIFK